MNNKRGYITGMKEFFSFMRSSYINKKATEEQVAKFDQQCAACIEKAETLPEAFFSRLGFSAITGGKEAAQAVMKA